MMIDSQQFLLNLPFLPIIVYTKVSFAYSGSIKSSFRMLEDESYRILLLNMAFTFPSTNFLYLLICRNPLYPDLLFVEI